MAIFKFNHLVIWLFYFGCRAVPSTFLLLICNFNSKGSLFVSRWQVCGFIDILSSSGLLITNRKVEVLTVGATYGMKGADFWAWFFGREVVSSPSWSQAFDNFNGQATFLCVLITYIGTLFRCIFPANFGSASPILLRYPFSLYYEFWHDIRKQKKYTVAYTFQGNYNKFIMIKMG